MNPRLFYFTAGTQGTWKIRDIRPLIGAGLDWGERLAVTQDPPTEQAAWCLRGIKSNERYVTRTEKEQLLAIQEGLGRPASRYASLIPIRKQATWWQMTQDERRAIFEEQSQHTGNGLRYLPEIARSLHHCRDLEGVEPFDFLTWFEFAPEDEPAFDALLAEMRATPEWDFVEREVDIRLER
ncbi:hypothetical protein GlitD10_1222 [Gloeomargarita lithophora Alchichica-D10]|uniref:hydrogen peroxide-dependent heme synthase n=1 Tax=Gloeomargarita lithophora Alchichica-D10 TaxID=1188229 RepID=A0A1J0AC82_9CYAN|nr:chlorite dismutase family protein [Gloeomargarita lithophora]APB33542.1 hypothetical protein GlitD10_1222 [Gloeomargarita lithophora Alchichica-D10]